ncbi:hypothetical protein [Amycolatopsis plumensis]|uniref:Uncharacterized protein n=1 Tax=Amycolatopsis plumensis TaxID=236508 RepID=A0ABV5U4C2_9PSEU
MQKDLDSFAVSPSPKDAEYGAPFLGASALAFFQQLVRDPEPVVNYLVKMGWAKLLEDERVQLNELGRIVLFGLGQEGLTEPQPPVVADVMLEPKDPLAWLNLTRIVATAGEGLLVDAFFKADYVHWLVDSTTIRRLLISSKHPQGQARPRLSGRGSRDRAQSGNP